MDEIDFGLCMSLVVNSRVPYKDLAEIFQMSVNSIHKRIKSLVDVGIVQNFNTKLSLINFSNPISVLLFGNSSFEYREELLDKIGRNESIYNVTRASGNLYYIHAHLKDFVDLDPLVSFIRNEGGISSLEIGLISSRPNPNAPTHTELDLISNSTHNEKKFSDLDFFIIDSLKNNSRKPISSNIGRNAYLCEI